MSWLFATPSIAARQASLSITNFRSSLKLTSIESVIPSSHLILCHPLLLLPLILLVFPILLFSSISLQCSLRKAFSPLLGTLGTLHSNGCIFPFLWELDYKESWVPKNWCFWIVVLEKTQEFPGRRSNQSILKEISPGCSLEGIMLKLKLQYFGHLMWRVDS